MSPASPTASSALATFGPATRDWFEQHFAQPTPVQERGWPRIAAGEHALLVAPTGSGKTLAAFLSAIDRLTRLAPDAPPGVRVLYVSPLKALAHDVERNLRAPLAGIERCAAARGVRLPRCPRVALRTGDTPARERRRQGREPAEILVTTPESLYLVLGSQQRETLATVETVIVDEIHAMAPSKRGAHLALSLERVSELAARDPQRLGLSATARPLEEVAGFLGGERTVAIVDAGAPPRLDLEVCVPVADLGRPQASGDVRTSPPAGLWPVLIPRLLEEIRARRSTIVFTNSRGLCERLAHELNERAGCELVRAHHGSVAHDERREIEEALKAGQLAGIVATSSLELGIDMQAVDAVLLVESPGGVARGLQRVGRAGHVVGEASRGRVFPKHRADLLEAAVVARGMRQGAVEAIRVPRNALDVLAQQIVAWCAVGPVELEALEALLRRTFAYRDLSREALHGVLDMLAGRYPSTAFAELRARIHWDREAGRLEGLAGSRTLALVSGGTIPDRGLYGVHRGVGGPRVGELDEEMVHETRVGETLTLGASTWRVEEITRDRVIVSPAPGESGKLPFWRGDGPGRPRELGIAMGAFVRALGEHLAAPEGRPAAEAWLREDYALDDLAARNLVDYVREQREATGTLPSDRAITIERFRDELGDWRVCILSPFGTPIHAPWAHAIEAALSAGGRSGQALWSDDGIMLRFPDADAPPPLEALVPDPDDVEARVLAQLGASALFAGTFRENAARALLLPRRRPGARTPLWTQRLRAQSLLAVAREFPSFPIVLETYRSCLQDVFDLPGLVALLRDIRAREVRVEEVETRQASPFARSLVFAYTAAYLYQGDSPVAERRAQALTLDSAMLRDLLGEESLRDLLDPRVIERTVAERQGRADGHRARHPDALHDLLRRVGDLSSAEVAERCDADAGELLSRLEGARRVLRVELAGEQRWIAAEDTALYRDAVAAAPPEGGVPDAFLAALERPLEQLLLRYARQRGPFRSAEAAARWDVSAETVERALASLAERGKLLAGEFRPGGSGPEWCDAEVLRSLRRRTLAVLRAEVAPVDAATLARFLPRWHGIGDAQGGESRLDAALEQLEGLPLSFAELERLVLPARVADYDPRMLDERGAQGRIVWIGRGALGERDGRVALYRRERVALLAEPAERPEELGPLARSLLDQLERRGACFLADLVVAVGDPPQRALRDALRELVWAGLVTNDHFAPLRELVAPRATRQRRGRRGHWAPAPAGRWSAVSSLVGDAVDPTRRAHARALVLLERYGVVTRDVMAGETVPGGFAAVYPVLRAMEEAGKLRRGLFVEGLPGAHFAYAGAVDRLRSARSTGEEVALLAATDPANPFGALLPWPAPRAGAAAPRRTAGASVVIVDGALALYLDRAGSRATTFPLAAEPRALERAARSLRLLFRERRRTALHIEEIDGEPACRSQRAAAFLAAGFREDYRALVLERSGESAAASR